MKADRPHVAPAAARLRQDVDRLSSLYRSRVSPTSRVSVTATLCTSMHTHTHTPSPADGRSRLSPRCRMPRAPLRMASRVLHRVYVWCASSWRQIVVRATPTRLRAVCRPAWVPPSSCDALPVENSCPFRRALSGRWPAQRARHTRRRYDHQRFVSTSRHGARHAAGSTPGRRAECVWPAQAAPCND